MGEEVGEAEIDGVAGLMQDVMDDNSVPKNIRKAVEDARAKLLGKEDMPLRVTSAIYLLDDVSNDINMPSHTRTEIWTLISQLEALKEKCK